MPDVLKFSEIDKLSEKEARKEYTRLRDILEKRVKRLKKSKKYSKKAEPYEKGGYNYFPKLRELKERPITAQLDNTGFTNMLHTLIKDLTNLIGPSAEEGLLSIKRFEKQRKDVDVAILKALHESNYEHISKSTLKKFGRFMEEMRKLYGKKNPSSEEQAEFFNSLKYRTKRRSTQFIVDLWRDYEKNGYQPDYGNQDLFAT